MLLTLNYIIKILRPYYSTKLTNRNEEKGTINRFEYNSKTHSTLVEKKFIPLYAEDLHFLIKRAGWLVSYIYKHSTFEQAKFKRDFVIGNQKARLRASSSVKRIF